MRLDIYHQLASLSFAIRVGILLIASLVLVWVSGLQPSPPFDSQIMPFLFQCGHAPVFGFFALGVLLVFGPSAPHSPTVISITLAVVAAAGYWDEWHQIANPARASDLKDVVTDLIGGVSAILLARWSSSRQASLRGGLLLLALILVGLSAWGWYSYDTEPWPLPLIDS